MNKTRCKLSEEHYHFLRQTRFWRLKLKFQLEERIEQTLGKAIPLQIKGQKVTLRIFARNIIKNKRMKKLFRSNLKSFTVKLHLNFLCLSTVFALNHITRTIYIQGSPFTFYTTITQSCKTRFLHFFKSKLVS